MLRPELRLHSHDQGVQTSEKLVEQGWVRRYLADEHRAKEALANYSAAGFEVHLERLVPEDFGSKCQSCAASVCLSYVVVYTRKKSQDCLEEAPHVGRTSD